MPRGFQKLYIYASEKKNFHYVAADLLRGVLIQNELERKSTSIF